MRQRSAICVHRWLLLLSVKTRIETELDEQLKAEISVRNQKVTRNRQLLMRLIKACFLGKRGLAFRGHDESDASSNRGNYVELLNCTAQYSSKALCLNII
ncbi:hypothetical protein AVEN_117348-1 [Araneus ventricosus]|uniref:DUF4371 domain-containing protein n=1 Tax=Araneus ventricosus TaxID=182803 RepID=A0A4Y2I0B7_ARAVE|nr:hypothetical protein AVEN_117348-1 [Araneus ventricosus]